MSVYLSFYGNPISKAIANSKIEAYIRDTYPDIDLEVSKTVYNFKFEEYVANVQSKESVDTTFSVHWDDEGIRDSYDSEVIGRWNTYERLQREFSDALEWEKEHEK